MDVTIMGVIVVVGVTASIPLAGLIARHRGRSAETWMLVAACLLGPLALPLLWLFPKQNRRAD
jgi:hypothetical protein